MARVDQAAVCIFCGDAPCSCDDLAPKRKRKAPVAQSVAPAFPAAEQTAPVQSKAGPLSGMFPEQDKEEVNHTARALQALLDSSILGKSGRWQVKQLLRQEVGDQTDRTTNRRIDEWKERNRGKAQVL